jgi:hypothetical protein
MMELATTPTMASPAAKASSIRHMLCKSLRHPNGEIIMPPRGKHQDSAKRESSL